MILVILDTAVNGRSAADVQIMCHPVPILTGAVRLEGRRVAFGRLGTQADSSSHGSLPKTKREPESRLPLGTPVWLRRFGWERQASMKCCVYSAAASVGGRTDTNTRPLALVRNSTRPLISANKV